LGLQPREQLARARVIQFPNLFNRHFNCAHA
jgi:hypothetical protein